MQWYLYVGVDYVGAWCVRYTASHMNRARRLLQRLMHWGCLARGALKGGWTCSDFSAVIGLPGKASAVFVSIVIQCRAM